MSTDQETLALRIARDVCLDYAGLNKLAIEWNKSIAEFREKHRLSEMLI